MQTLILSVLGKDLDDALSFNRLKGDVKKLVARFRLAIVHDALLQFERKEKRPFPNAPTEADLERYADALVQLGKSFAAKLSEDLVPATPMNAHHLGLVEVESVGESTLGKIVAVKKEILERQFAQRAAPIIAPIVKTKSGRLRFVSADALAARLAAELNADMLFFIDDAPSGKNEAREALARESLSNGVRRAFVATLSGLEAVALRNEKHTSEISLSATT